MTYILFRVILILLILLGLFYINKKLPKKIIIIVSSVLIILCTISFFFPAENLFISFDSPEKAFNYCRIGEIKGVLYGDESCLIYYRTNSETYSYVFIPKTDKGYKLPETHYSEIVANRFDTKGKFEVHRVNKTNDYYVIGHTVVFNNSIIKDSNNQLISNVICSDTTGTNAIIFYSYIDDYSNEYYLLIINEKISFTGQSGQSGQIITQGTVLNNTGDGSQ